jgi:hypothetical protein
MIPIRVPGPRLARRSHTRSRAVPVPTAGDLITFACTTVTIRD